MRALIDGDVIVYRSGFSAEQLLYQVKIEGEVIAEFPYKKDVVEFLELHDLLLEEVELTTYIIPEPVENALKTVKNTINSIVNDINADSYTIFLSEGSNFRKDIAKTHEYKGQRPARKPLHYNIIREYLLDIHDAVMRPLFEADDLMGIEQTKFKDTTCICTNDKDLNMIAGWHYNWVDMRKFFITEQEADWNFFKQLLIGDTVDNIKGLYGVGEVTAEKMLSMAEHEGVSPLCMAGLHYACQFDDPESRLIENAQLLWILRDEGEIGAIPPLISQVWNTDYTPDP